jgi:hypothetical protein
MDDEVRDLIRNHLADPDSGWSVGVPGAIAEFARLPGEPAQAIPDGIVTDRGGLRITVPTGCRAVAYETPVGPHDHWNHAVVFCLPERDACHAAAVLTELGPTRPAAPRGRRRRAVRPRPGQPRRGRLRPHRHPALIADLRGACGWSCAPGRWT